jgi:hypothetical protein
MTTVCLRREGRDHRRQSERSALACGSTYEGADRSKLQQEGFPISKAMYLTTRGLSSSWLSHVIYLTAEVT